MFKMVSELKIRHILISDEEKIIYLACRDNYGASHLYCIYDKRFVKTYTNGRWEVLNSIFSKEVITLAEQSLYEKPTFRVKNILSQFVN